MMFLYPDKSNMKPIRYLNLAALLLGFSITAVVAQTDTTSYNGQEYHVDISGKDTNPGTKTAPFRTIRHAADVAQPGDVITVHQGVYREHVSPPRGGESGQKRITYQAAPGEHVQIKGSELVTNWVKVQNDTWKATLPNSFFGDFNPYTNVIHGGWFQPRKQGEPKSMDRVFHTGAVYLNGDWLDEAPTLDEALGVASTNALWFGSVDATNTTLWAQFEGVDPNRQMVEINVRQTVFYPDQEGRNYITVRGFDMSQAATQWASPIAVQYGLIGPHWSKGWIIESNKVSYSRCAGISLGKYDDPRDKDAGKYVSETLKANPKVWFAPSNREETFGVIDLAIKHGWSKDTVGHHIVRNNEVFNCEQAGIVGHLGAVFSVITGNSVHDTYVRRLFHGSEQAGIKIHAAIDVEISHNHLYRNHIGIWLDWMAQGTRVTGNLFHDNTGDQDLIMEIDHGPIVVDNNIFLSPFFARGVISRSVAFTHNLIGGKMPLVSWNLRIPPFCKPHSTEIAGVHDCPSGDHSFYNNLFVKDFDNSEYDTHMLMVRQDGNVFLDATKHSRYEKNALFKPDFDSGIKIIEKPDGWYLEMQSDKAWKSERTRKLVTTELLGTAWVPDQPYTNPDGSPLKINTDYFGKQRDESNPFPGPFETTETGRQLMKVWPLN